MNHNYKIGSKVKIVDPGRIYSTYWGKFKEMGFKELNKPKGIYNDRSKYLGKEFTIFSISRHDFTSAELFGIEDNLGNQYLIGRSGIKLIA